MKTIIRLIILTTLLFALPAYGAIGSVWSKTASATTTSDGCARATHPKTCYLVDVGTADGDTPTIYIGNMVCYVRFDDDTDVDAGGAGQEATLSGCPTSTAAAASCNEIYDDAGAVSFNGDATVGRAAMYGIEGRWIYFTVDKTNEEPFLIEVGCRRY